MTQTLQYEPVVARNDGGMWNAGVRHVPTGRVINVWNPLAGGEPTVYFTKWGARRAARRVARRMNRPDRPESTSWESA